MTMSFSFSEMLICILVLLVSLYLYFRSSRSNNPRVLPTNWPMLHMFPSFIVNLHNLPEYCTVVLTGSGHNFRAHGPPGTGMRFFVTSHPANVRHIFTTNYANFPKGEEFAAIFDIMGGSLFTIDGETARRPRAKAQTFFSNMRFVADVAARCRDKVENSLLPILVHMARTDTPVNMEELMARCMFDLTTMTVFGVDLGTLSADVPSMDASDAMDIVMEVGFLRHMMPAYCWKAMRWLNIGPERRLHRAHIALRGFISEMMMKRSKINGKNYEEQDGADVVSFLINDPDYADDGILSATTIASFLATRDTITTALPWIFYNLAKNPDIVSNIRNELSPIASGKMFFETEKTGSLVYLTAVLYETLRLYPPVPIERKTVANDDIMPSGHAVHAGDTILISIYSMGRIETVWGKDYLDYNPDRWLSEDGRNLRYVPSHKFLAFNSGPRICPGKGIALMQMKTIVAAVVWNFDVEIVEGQIMEAKMSSLLRMKNGLIVKLNKREI